MDEIRVRNPRPPKDDQRHAHDRDIVVKVLASGAGPVGGHRRSLAQGEAVTIGADDDAAAEILRAMARHQVQRLPAIDGRRLVGIVAIADVARALPDRPVDDLIDAISRRRSRQL